MNAYRTSRRRFLGQASSSAVSSIPLLNTLLNLKLAGSVANAAPPVAGEYRAIVCLFLSGGNDSFNMLSPYSGPSSTHENSRTEYVNSRGNLALDLEDLHQIHPTNTPDRTFGVHPSMPNLAARFDAAMTSPRLKTGSIKVPTFATKAASPASKRAARFGIEGCTPKVRSGVLVGWI